MISLRIPHRSDCINGDLIWTGFPQQVYSSVCRSVSGLTRGPRSPRFKLGITNDPRRRFSAHGDAFDEMILLYRSNSISHVSQMEAQLIEHNRDFAANRVGGGAGAIGNSGPYYFYVVRKRRFRGRPRRPFFDS